MRLLFVVNVDWFFLSHRLPIALEAKRHGYDVHVATGLTDKQAELEAHGLTVHPLNLKRGSTNLVDLVSTIRDISRVFRMVQPDIVHLVTIKPVLLGGLAARWNRVPAVVAAISGLGTVFVARGLLAMARRWIAGRLYRMALKQQNIRVIFQNPSDHALLTNLCGLTEQQTLMIDGSGVDLGEYICRPVPDGDPVIMLASRLLYSKGIGEFVEAAKIVRSKYSGPETPPRFVLVGAVDPDNPASVPPSHIDQWVADGTIEYRGQRKDMPEVLSSATIIVLPSYYGEGLPKILIEAAACCRAVITTDHPGCRDAIEPDVSGLLVPVRDSEALAEAILRLLADPELRQKLSAAGRQLAERRFDIATVVEKHMAAYSELSPGGR